MCLVGLLKVILLRDGKGPLRVIIGHHRIVTGNANLLHIHLATCNDILLWMPILNMIIQVLQFLEVIATVGAEILRCLVILLMPL